MCVVEEPVLCVKRYVEESLDVCKVSADVKLILRPARELEEESLLSEESIFVLETILMNGWVVLLLSFLLKQLNLIYLFFRKIILVLVSF